MFKISMVRNRTCSEKQAITLTFQSTKPKCGIFPHNYINIILGLPIETETVERLRCYKINTYETHAGQNFC